MSTKPDGGPVFPDPGRAQSAKQREVLTDTGMSLRDHFAGQAMAGLVGNPLHMANITKEAAARGVDRGAGIAQFCYEMADYMIAERAK